MGKSADDERSGTLTRTILIMAGGTGGHIYPGLAVADKLQARGWNIAWLGTKGGMESRIVPDHGYPIYSLRIFGIRGKGLLNYLLLPLHLSLAFYQSMKIILKVKPNLVLSMGGYVAFPGGVISYLNRLPLIVHEQNAVAGLTNKLLSKIASKTLVAFPKTLPGAFHTGNPTRSNIKANTEIAEKLSGREGPLRILVVGGSRGSDSLNKIVPEAFSLLPLHKRPLVTHQSGSGKLFELSALYEKFGVDGKCVEFISDIGNYYRGVDLIICRSGAMTISEISVVGVASILVPFPHAVDDHQTKNALFLVKAGAALLMPQDKLSPKLLAENLLKITRKDLSHMALKAQSLGVSGSTELIADFCEKEIANAA